RSQSSGVKAQKDRVTLIMCGNATGHMLKPGLIYKSANPKALKNKNKNLLPVFWIHNPKAWIMVPAVLCPSSQGIPSQLGYGVQDDDAVAGFGMSHCWNSSS
ncbi:hypothetical protein P4O66_016287, partial [Electrophorus voltai]